MTRKDYVAIARILASIRMPESEHQFTRGHEGARETIALDFAEHCATDNPRFDRARFLKACGIA